MSRLIRAVTQEPVSHCGILDSGYVLHSNLLGIRCEPLDEFLEHSQIVVSVPVTPKPDLVERIVEMGSRPGKSWYDFGALLFLGGSLFLRAKLRIPLPKSNLWQSTGMYLCTELVTDIVYGEEQSMLTPYQLCLQLEKKEN